MVSDALPPVSAYSTTQKRSLSPQQLEKSLERLYTRSVNTTKERDEEYWKAVNDQLEHNKLKKVATGDLTDEEKTRIDHLYTQPIERKKKADQSASKKSSEHTVSNVKHVTQDEQDAIVDRLYGQAIQSHAQQLAGSLKRVYGDSSTNKGKTLDKDGLAAAVEALYTKAIEKKKTADSQLQDKYGWKKIVSEKKITPEEAKTLAERLQKK
jgi:hypothetical protein